MSTRGDTLVLALGGRLDAVAGRLLVDAMEGAGSAGVAQIEVDVGGVTSYSPEGASALAACRNRTNGGVPGGLHYRAGTAPGHKVLLAAASRPAYVIEASGSGS